MTQKPIRIHFVGLIVLIHQFTETYQMKKISTTILIAIFITTSANAQIAHTKPSANINWGLKGGISFERITGTELDKVPDDYASLLGFTGGLFANISIKNNMQLQSEINLNSNGFMYASSDPKLLKNFKETFIHLTIPVLVKYGGIKKGLFIYAGIQMSKRIIAWYESGKEFKKLMVDNKNNQLMGIAGIDFTITKGIHCDMRYQFGTGKINKLSTGSEWIKNNAFTLTAG